MREYRPFALAGCLVRLLLRTRKNVYAKVQGSPSLWDIRIFISCTSFGERSPYTGYRVV